MKPLNILFSSQHSFQSLIWYQWTSNTSSVPVGSRRPQPTCRGRERRLQLRPTRPYATVIDDEKTTRSPLRWPKPDRAGVLPTPYQIFNQQKDAPYSKGRFYELVKIYHPDRIGCLHQSAEIAALPHAERVDRYRLVIAANEILSDPVKRKAYDRLGLGWGAGAAQHGATSSPSYKRHWENGGKEYWRGGDSPRANATWEDWERWHRRGSGERQQPVFVQNRAFLSLIIMFAALGGVVEILRARSFSLVLSEQRDHLHDVTYSEMERRRKELGMDFRGKEDRLQHFLRMRDPAGYGGMMSMDQRQQVSLPGPEVSSSDDIKGRPMTTSHQDSDQRDDKATRNDHHGEEG